MSSPDTPSILIVDDHPPNLLAVSAVLTPLQVRIVEASSGAEAVRCVERESFAVVLLDVQMPVMDGFETARRIRDLPGGRELPILFLTAIYADAEYARRGYASGAADYITKPFEPEVLRARVRAFVDLYSQREAVHRSRIEARTRERDEAQRRLSAFERISTAALETTDLEVFLHTLLTIFVQAADSADSAAIMLRRGDELQARAAIGFPQDVVMHFRVRVGEGFAGQVAASGRPQFVSEDDREAAARLPWLRDFGLRALYGVPLVYEGEVIGVAHIGSTSSSEFSAAEKGLLGAMVERAAWAFSRQRARDRLFAVLNSAPALISVWRGPEYLCEFANDACRRQFGGREIVGRRGTELGVTPEIVAVFDRVLLEGETFSLEEHATTADFRGDGVPEERIFHYSFHP
ncbi:MAG: response regulator, partial [Myxococcales bacterium]|nr:response regulator [Myxococcales bacterium]